MADGSYFRFDDGNKIKYTYSFQIIIDSYYVSTQVANSVCAHERVILVFISRVAQITSLSASTVRRVSTYIILFLTRYNESIIDDNNDDLYIDPISHSLFLHSADDVTMDWWWRHYDQTILSWRPFKNICYRSTGICEYNAFYWGLHINSSQYICTYLFHIDTKIISYTYCM